MEYKGYKIQITESEVFIRNSKGEIIMRTPTVKEAEEWIDENKDNK